MKPLAVLIALAALCIAFGAAAAGAPIEENPLDSRTRVIAEQLRCLVCQGESVADSHAPLAADMRAEIRTQIEQGRSDREIIDYFVSRYGDFVLYQPPFEAKTWALWFGPLAALLLGLGLLFVHLRRRAQLPAAAMLSPIDTARAQALLSNHGQPPR